MNDDFLFGRVLSFAKTLHFGCFHGEVFVGGRGTSKTSALKYVFIFTLTWGDDPI